MDEEKKAAEAAAKAEEEKKKRLEDGWENKSGEWEKDKAEIKNKAMNEGKNAAAGGSSADEKLSGGDTGPLAHVGEEDPLPEGDEVSKS